MKAQAPIIIIRKKRHGHGGGHHGGAWKVAYADFVTAMMAFFLVMWLAGSNQEIKEQVAGYFRDPGVMDYAKSDGPIDGGRVGAEPGRAPQPIPPQDPSVLAQERAILTKAAETIRERLTGSGLTSLREQIELTITAEGLRIELVERTGSSFFDSGSAVLRGESENILRIIAAEVRDLPNDLVLEGHTDQQAYAASAKYSNWELSTDRANAARRAMENGGLQEGRTQGIRGFADTRLHHKDNPLDPRNRRISIVVRSQAATALEAAVLRHSANGASR